MHTHNSPASSTYSIFGWGDLVWIRKAYKSGAVDSDTVFVLATADGTQYALTISDWNDFLNAVFVRVSDDDEFDMEKMNAAERIRKKYFEGDYVDDIWTEGLITENNTNNDKDLKYFVQMMEKNMMGMNLFEINQDFTKFTQISTMLINGQVKRTPCN